MKSRSKLLLSLCAAGTIGFATPTHADDLFKDSQWSQFASDRRASRVGDILSVIIAESAEARNSARNATGRSTSLSGSASTDGSFNSGELSLGSRYTGTGEIRRSESLLTSISVQIDEVLPNGDYMISGEQRMHVNGQWTTIGIRGRIRDADISGDNQIFSDRIANAEINYDGEGFVSRGAKPGILGWLFSMLRIG